MESISILIPFSKYVQIHCIDLTQLSNLWLCIFWWWNRQSENTLRTLTTSGLALPILFVYSVLPSYVRYNANYFTVLHAYDDINHHHQALLSWFLKWLLNKWRNFWKKKSKLHFFKNVKLAINGYRVSLIFEVSDCY